MLKRFLSLLLVTSVQPKLFPIYNLHTVHFPEDEVKTNSSIQVLSKLPKNSIIENKLWIDSEAIEPNSSLIITLPEEKSWYDDSEANSDMIPDSSLSTNVMATINVRWKRSKLTDRFRKLDRKSNRGKKGKKTIRFPTLYIDPVLDGFENIFYEEMVLSAICLTSNPEINRHELVDEYEALLCQNKGYGRLLKNTGASKNRSKRETEVEDEGGDGHKWYMNKTNYDVLWNDDSNVTTTVHPLHVSGSDESEYYYDYEYEGEYPNSAQGNVTTGWDSGDEPEDPSHFDYRKWPKFLPDGVTDDDEIRSKIHSHPENFTLEYFKGNLFLNDEEIPFEKRKFALNESFYLSNYYNQLLKLSPYSLKPLIKGFFSKPEELFKSFTNDLNLKTLRDLFIIFIIDVHHVNCFNRHIRYYGYIMKKPASINGDEITNDARLARGIIMRSLELIRHIPLYNDHKDYILRLLIAALKERAFLSKSLTTLIGENDYTELYEVATYLEHTLKNGIHPDQKNKDLFVEETRFYTHHFMNTLTL